MRQHVQLFSRNKEDQTAATRDTLIHYAETVRALDIKIESAGIYHGQREEQDRLDAMISDTINSERAEREKILQLLQLVEDPNRHAVLRLRYCFCMDWREIAAVMCDDVDCVEAVEDRHIKRCLTLHRRAVEELHTKSKDDRLHT